MWPSEHMIECIFRSNLTPDELNPQIGDVIIDFETGPLLYFHAALVVSDYPTNEKYAIIMDYGLGKNMKMKIDYNFWKYQNTSSKTVHKYAFRFHPPKSIQLSDRNIQLASYKLFQSCIQSRVIQLKNYYMDMGGEASLLENTRALLNAGLPNCGTPKFKNFEARLQNINSCKQTDKKAIFCSKFVIQALQLALYDWLDYEYSDSQHFDLLRSILLSADEKKHIIEKFLPLAAERCAPRFIRDAFIKSVYWKLIKDAKPTRVILKSSKTQKPIDLHSYMSNLDDNLCSTTFKRS